MSDFRERTDEFAAIASVVARQRHSSGAEQPKRSEAEERSHGSALATRTHFTLVASELGKDIHRTSEKLQKLASCLSISLILLFSCENELHFINNDDFFMDG